MVADELVAALPVDLAAAAGPEVSFECAEGQCEGCAVCHGGVFAEQGFGDDGLYSVESGFSAAAHFADFGHGVDWLGAGAGGEAQAEPSAFGFQHEAEGLLVVAFGGGSEDVAQVQGELVVGQVCLDVCLPERVVLRCECSLYGGEYGVGELYA